MRRFIQHNNYAHCWQYCVWVFPLLLSVARPQNIKNWTYKQNTPSTRKKSKNETGQNCENASNSLSCLIEQPHSAAGSCQWPSIAVETNIRRCAGKKSSWKLVLCVPNVAPSFGTVKDFNSFTEMIKGPRHFRFCFFCADSRKTDINSDCQRY